ncbi:MAG: hypothetical protein KAS99_02065 [Candidatus Omnitrophica bacterium]|nr:hypothetical protein [Candidatus Omnitrophota bacterium]
MSIQKGLAGLEMYNSMTVLPFEGVKGLGLYLKQKESSKNQMIKNLKCCQEFCNVVKRLFIDRDKAIIGNVSVLRGMEEIYADKEKREELTRKIGEVSDVINSILEDGRPREEQVKKSMRVLEDVVKDTERKLDKADYEKVILGKYSTL